MSLLEGISIPQESSNDPERRLFSDRVQVKDLVLNPDRFNEVKDQIGELQPESLHCVLSLGGVHARHVLAYVLEAIGPCRLFFTTWAFSLRSVKMIIDMNDHGLIDFKGCILSDRVETVCPQAFQLLKANTDRYWLKKNHAKGFIAWNDQWKVSVRMTANFTENTRCETFDIMTMPKVWQQHKHWIEHITDEIID
jgi:hypothetical protein